MSMERKKMQKTFYMYKINGLLNISEIVTIHYQKLTKTYSYPSESHDFWEIIYCDKNELLVVAGGETHTLKKGEIIFIAPNVEHSVRSNGLADPNIFIVSFVCRSKSMGYFRDKIFTVPEELRYLLASIMTEAKNTFVIPDFNPNLNRLALRPDPSIGGAQIIKNNLEELFVKLIRVETAKPSSQTVFISKVEDSDALEDEIMRILERSVYGTITLDEISGELHYGKTSLCQVFRKRTGKTIIGYYLELKIEESKRLIREDKTFSEIADLLGFDSLPHFTKTFKRLTTMTPREFKNSIL